MKHLKLNMILLVLATSLFLCGCSSDYDSVYDSVQVSLEDIANQSAEVPDKAHATAAEMWYNTCVSLKQYAPFVMVGSFMLGLIVFIIFRREKSIRKWALYVLMISIPAVTFICTYLICFLYGCFNF